jgi:hypothetical protein
MTLPGLEHIDGLTKKAVGSGRPKRSKMPKVYKVAHTPIHKSYREEYNERQEELDLETEKQMKERLME